VTENCFTKGLVTVSIMALIVGTRQESLGEPEAARARSRNAKPTYIVDVDEVPGLWSFAKVEETFADSI
jgi:hypothetical protein